MVKKLYKQDIESCFGTKPNGGLSRNNFNQNLNKLSLVKKDIYNYQGGKILPLLSVVKQKDDIKFLKEIADKIRKDFSSLIILGTGGSTLNPQSMVALKQELNPDFKIYFADNIDPFFTESLFSGINLKETAFLAISKSGGTVEVLAHVLLSIEKLESSGIKNIGRHFFIISDPIKNILRDIGEEIGATILDHEADIGGRFSTFTKVGLLPALIAGCDATKFRSGAERVVENFISNENSYPLEGAALAMTSIQSGLSINVFMPYLEALKPFTTWVCQIWAESLGKNGNGSTPVRAAGTLDQHSQLQLYLDGPADKLFNIIGIENPIIGPSISSRFTKRSDISYLGGKTFGEVNMAAQSGTAITIASRGRPVRVFSLSKLNEECLGALMMHFTLETILCAQDMGINAFDQPAVEDGKILARKILGQKEVA